MWLIRLIVWLVSLALIPVGVAFAVANRDTVLVSLEPLYYVSDWPACGEGMICGVEMPLYFVVLIAIALGFVWGGAAAWVGGAMHRRMARDKAYEASKAKREIAGLKDHIRTLEASREADEDEAKTSKALTAEAPASASSTA